MLRISKELRDAVTRLQRDFEDLRYTNCTSEEIFAELKYISDRYYELDVFSDKQIEAIIYGIMLDLDINKILFYAKPNFDADTMNNMAFLFYRGFPVKKVIKIFRL